MLETSKDLLFIALAFCAVLFTAFVCILLYYFIAIIKNAHDITKSIKQKVEMIDSILKTIKEQINSTASYIGIIFNGVEKVIDYVQKKNATKSKKSTKKKAKAKVIKEEEEL